MKSQILKQSAIAFFVGSVISGTAFSADSQPTSSENPYAAFEKALTDKISAGLTDRFVSKDEGKASSDKIDKLEKQIKNLATETQNGLTSVAEISGEIDKKAEDNKKAIDKVSSNLTNLITKLGDDNEELDKTLDEHEKGIIENAENINKVVDRVNENQKATDEAIKKVYETQDKLIDESTKLRENVEDIGDALADHDKALDEKATKAEINTLKATLGEQLDKQKEELGKQAASLHAKAGRQEMNEALDKKADVAELDKLTEDVAKDLDDQEMRLDDHEKALKAVDNRVTENESNIATINENLVQLAEKSDVMSAQLNAATEGVEEHDKAIAELKETKEYTEAAKIKGSFDVINSDLDHISDAVKTNGENIEGLDGNIKANSDKISENAEGLQALANAQNELSDAHEALADLHDGLRSEHDTLDKTVKANKQDADKRFKATGEALNHIAGKLGDTETKLANDIDTVGKDLGVTKKASDDNANNIRRNLSSIQANSRLGNANHADIADLQTKVATHTTQISQNSHRIDQVNSRVDRLQKEVKRGLAAQAALTGLFQPYKVGHANFTAAVGGYKSQTAVAVGTGYRFNENVAAKAGVAFSTNGGGAAYNAGVNFEW